MMYCVLSNYNRWHISCLRGVFGKLWGWSHLSQLLVNNMIKKFNIQSSSKYSPLASTHNLFRKCCIIVILWDGVHTLKYSTSNSRTAAFQIVYPWGSLWWLGSTKSHREQDLDSMEDVVKSWFHVCQGILSPWQTCEQMHYHETS